MYITWQRMRVLGESRGRTSTRKIKGALRNDHPAGGAFGGYLKKAALGVKDEKERGKREVQRLLKT